MSESPHPTDVEVSRALNALVTTLNDRKVSSEDPHTLQDIVTGSLGGERRILVRSAGAAGAASSAELTDAGGKVLARIRFDGARWLGERAGPPFSGAYIPSAG
jgi:hypothetical protein